MWGTRLTTRGRDIRVRVVPYFSAVVPRGLVYPVFVRFAARRARGARATLPILLFEVGI